MTKGRKNSEKVGEGVWGHGNEDRFMASQRHLHVDFATTKMIVGMYMFNPG
jgi:hypothetical protein